MNAPAYSFSPSSGTVTPSRPRVPNKARYLQYGFYAQDNWEAVPNMVWLSGSLRYSVASYRAQSSDSPIVNGKPLWPSDSLRAGDFSGRAGIVVAPVAPLHLAFNYSRGYRAPNITDLGTLGLTGDGYEVAAPDVSGLGATIGTSADDKAISSGLPVVQLESEWTNNYDLSVRYNSDRFNFSTTGFIIDFQNTITKQSLILPQGAVGLSLGGQQITNQLANGVVFVAASSAPVLVRANYGPADIKGFESELDARITRDLTFAGNFTYIRAEDDFGMAPNIEGGTPPATGFMRLRYEQPGSRWWVEAYSTLVDRQNRLSSLDISDRRTGAKRSTSSIASFFNNGARVRGLIGNGPDGVPYTADDVLIPTGETLSDVQHRLLGTKDSAPLFPYLPGYGLVGVRGGYRFGEGSDLFGAGTVEVHGTPPRGVGVDGVRAEAVEHRAQAHVRRARRPDRADRRTREERDRRLRDVRHERDDAIALFHAERLQARRNRADRALELRPVDLGLRSQLGERDERGMLIAAMAQDVLGEIQARAFEPLRAGHPAGVQHPAVRRRGLHSVELPDRLPERLELADRPLPERFVVAEHESLLALEPAHVAHHFARPFALGCRLPEELAFDDGAHSHGFRNGIGAILLRCGPQPHARTGLVVSLATHAR